MTPINNHLLSKLLRASLKGKLNFNSLLKVNARFSLEPELQYFRYFDTFQMPILSIFDTFDTSILHRNQILPSPTSRQN